MPLKLSNEGVFDITTLVDVFVVSARTILGSVYPLESSEVLISYIDQSALVLDCNVMNELLPNEVLPVIVIDEDPSSNSVNLLSKLFRRVLMSSKHACNLSKTLNQVFNV